MASNKMEVTLDLKWTTIISHSSFSYVIKKVDPSYLDK